MTDPPPGARPTKDPCPQAGSWEHQSHDHLGSKVIGTSPISGQVTTDGGRYQSPLTPGGHVTLVFT